MTIHENLFILPNLDIAKENEGSKKWRLLKEPTTSGAVSRILILFSDIEVDLRIYSVLYFCRILQIVPSFLYVFRFP